MNKRPEVSVVMPLYNSSSFMDESIQSVCDQSFNDFELLLVDDASTDDTLQRAEAWSRSDNRILVASAGRNAGAGVCRNSGIELANGRYIAFLDSDDLWSPIKLEHQLAEIEKSRAALSYTDYFIHRENGLRTKLYEAPNTVTYHELLKHCSIGCSTVIYDTLILGKRYFPLVRKRQDFGLWLSILKDIDRACKCGAALTTYRVRSGSISANKFEASMYTWNIYRQQEQLSIFSSIYFLLHHSLSAARKRL